MAPHPSPTTTWTNHGRILAKRHQPGCRGPRGYLWDGPQSLPQLVGNHAFAFAWDMNDDGDVTGYRGGFLGVGTRAWVSQLGAETVTELPSPRAAGTSPPWACRSSAA